ncbi:MAG TPA: hypothetical protein VMK66_02420 [Myxococcales bacterium]|nr:hypothetical protein [Myxococcales bacterium]
MEKLREWGFPVALVMAWMAAAAYTVSLLIGPPDAAVAPAPEKPAIADSNLPAS